MKKISEMGDGEPFDDLKKINLHARVPLVSIGVLYKCFQALRDCFQEENSLGKE